MFRKNIEDVFKNVSSANEIVQTLLTEEMKAELMDQVLYIDLFSSHLFTNYLSSVIFFLCLK